MEDEKMFPNEKVIVTKNFDVHQDWEVPIPGFFTIASVRKIKSVADFNEEESEEFTRLLVFLRRGMREILEIDEAYIFQNEDSNHRFHLWFFPRHEWMERFGRKIESVRPIINYAKENMRDDETVEQVKQAVTKMRQYMKSRFEN